MKKLPSTVNQAIQSQMKIMEHFLHDMIRDVNDAQEHIYAGESSAAIGALVACEETLKHLRIIYDAILVTHHNAQLIDNNEQ